MRSRWLEELTTPEVEAYFARGGKTAFLPVGAVEMHGPHQPIGTDTLVGKAFALRLAEATDGIVLPEMHYTWAGSTDGFPGTISIDPGLVTPVVEAVLLRAHRMGFSRLIVLSIHAPHNWILALTVRRFFEKHHIPAVFANPYNPLSKEVAAMLSGEREQGKEASLVLAALKILGKEALYSEAEMCREEQAPPLPASFNQILPLTVGYFMQDPRQHACPSKHISLAAGLEFIDAQVKLITPRIAAIDRYTEEIHEQWNQGWTAAENHDSPAPPAP